MSVNQKAFLELIDRYTKGTASEAERILVEETLKRMGNEEGNDQLSSDEEAVLKQLLFQRTLQQIASRAKSPAVVVRLPFYRRRIGKIAAAAIFLLTMAGAGWFFLQEKHQATATALQPEKPRYDAAPGRTGAVLTLSDGSTIVLDSAGNGLLAHQKGTEVIKSADGLTYQSKKGVAEIAYNTMTTPKGREYNITLSDGTRVWLNAASSITFPTTFVGKDRSVSITGEVYFEVTKNSRMPFVVKVADGEEVQVLGTHFNINAYDNEPVMQTTLLEGAVSVHKGDQVIMIQPGQQAISVRGRTAVNILPADIDEVMAWKEGFFQFDHADLKYLLRQLSRWYDLEIVFEGNPVERKLGGRINRSLNLSAVLNVLEAKDIHYRMEGKKLIVQS